VHAIVARDERKIPFAAIVRVGKADACLLLTVEGCRRVVGVASVPGVDAGDDRATIPLEPEERADTIHDPQDSNSPAGKTDEADIM
jgi:hypothetical protein